MEQSPYLECSEKKVIVQGVFRPKMKMGLKTYSLYAT